MHIRLPSLPSLPFVGSTPVGQPTQYAPVPEYEFQAEVVTRVQQDASLQDQITNLNTICKSLQDQITGNVIAIVNQINSDTRNRVDAENSIGRQINDITNKEVIYDQHIAILENNLPIYVGQLQQEINAIYTTLAKNNIK